MAQDAGIGRRGSGYSFEVMRARILYGETVRPKLTSTRKRRPADDSGIYGIINLDSNDLGGLDDVFGHGSVDMRDHGPRLGGPHALAAAVGLTHGQ